MTPDQDLSAQLEALAAIANRDGLGDGWPLRNALFEAYRSGQLITLADHERAVQAAVAKAVKALTVDIAVVQAELRVALGGCDANGGWNHRPISIPSSPKDIFCQDCGEMLDKATAKRHMSAAANRTPSETLAAIISRGVAG